MTECAHEHGRRGKALDAGAMGSLRVYQWPGNVLSCGTSWSG